MQATRIHLGRVARSTLVAVGAIAFNDCSAHAIYGFSCIVDGDASCQANDDSSPGDELTPVWNEASAPRDANADPDADVDDADRE